MKLTLTSTSDAKTSRETAEFCRELGAERVVVLPPKGTLDGSLPDELARFREEFFRFFCNALYTRTAG